MRSGAVGDDVGAEARAVGLRNVHVHARAPIPGAGDREVAQRAEQRARQALLHGVRRQVVDLEREPEARTGAPHLGVERHLGLAHGETRAGLDPHHARVPVLRDAAVEQECERRLSAALVGDAEAGASREPVVGAPLERGVERHVLVAREEPRGRELGAARAVRERERVEPREQRVAAHDVDVGELQLGQPPGREQQRVGELLGRGAHAGRGGGAARSRGGFLDGSRFARGLGLGREHDARAAQLQSRDARAKAAKARRQRRLGTVGAKDERAGPAPRGGCPAVAEREAAQHHRGGPFEREPAPRRLEPARAGERAHAAAEPGREQHRHEHGHDHEQRRREQDPAERTRQRGETGHGAARLRSRRRSREAVVQLTGAALPACHSRHSSRASATNDVWRGTQPSSRRALALDTERSFRSASP
jgi:hypothetical protein